MVASLFLTGKVYRIDDVVRIISHFFLLSTFDVMVNSMNDLWAEDIGVTTVKTPVAILKEQASLLGNKTQNLVIGEVLSSSQDNNSKDARITHRFNVKAPVLGNYSYMLFAISHGIDIYPLRITVDDSIVPTLSLTRNPVTIDSESKFLELLANILKSKRTTQIVHALLAQSLESGGVEEIVDVNNEQEEFEHAPS